SAASWRRLAGRRRTWPRPSRVRQRRRPDATLSARRGSTEGNLGGRETSMHELTRRGLLRAGLAGFGATWGAAAAAPLTERSFHFDHILGTSLDVWVRGGSLDAAEQACLDEIERLRRVFSVHDSESELSRLNRADGPFTASDDLASVLAT